MKGHPDVWLRTFISEINYFVLLPSLQVRQALLCHLLCSKFGVGSKGGSRMVKNDTVAEIVSRGERREKKDHVLNQAPFEIYKTIPSTRHLIPSIWPQIPWICRLTMVWGGIRSLSSWCCRPSLPGSLLHSPYWPTAELLPLGSICCRTYVEIFIPWGFSLHQSCVFPVRVPGVLLHSEHG